MVDPIARFWAWFIAHAAALRAEKNTDVAMSRIAVELAKVSEGVFAEVAPNRHDRWLVLTADQNPAFFPLVYEIHAAQPSTPGWTIVAFRQRARPDELPVKMGLNDLRFDSSTFRFVAHSAGDKLDLEVYLPGFLSAENMDYFGSGTLDKIVGEFDMATKIGKVVFESLDNAPATAKPLAELSAVLDTLS